MTRLRLRKNGLVLSFFVLCTTALLWRLLELLFRTESRSAGHNAHSFVVNKRSVISEATTTVSTTQAEPLILLYNPLFNVTNWFSLWTNVKETQVVFQLQHCPTVCHFTSDRYLQRFADLVLVSVSGYSRWGGQRP